VVDLETQEYFDDINKAHAGDPVLVPAGDDEPPTLFEPIVMTKKDKIVIGAGSRIDSFVKLEGGLGLTIGRNVHIASFAHLGIGGGELVLEDFTAVASGAKLICGGNHADGLTMSASAPAVMQRVVSAKTVMKRYSCVLTNGIVLSGVTLGEGAVLAAGGVATKDIPAWEIWAGCPAKFLAKRKIT
jgi:galactoside O-acetyltransferase